MSNCIINNHWKLKHISIFQIINWIFNNHLDIVPYTCYNNASYCEFSRFISHFKLSLSFVSVSTVSHYSLEKLKKKNLGMKILKLHIYATIERNKGQKSPSKKAPLFA